jgi:hypothetical protein
MLTTKLNLYFDAKFFDCELQFFSFEFQLGPIKIIILLRFMELHKSDESCGECKKYKFDFIVRKPRQQI